VTTIDPRWVNSDREQPRGVPMTHAEGGDVGMSGVRALGYIGITSDGLDEWRRLAGPVLGTEVLDRGDSWSDIRLDRRAWRVRITAAATAMSLPSPAGK